MEAKPTIRFRKLRTAWSVVCGVLCLLLILVWVRSHWAKDTIACSFGSNEGFLVKSDWGAIELWHVHKTDWPEWKVTSFPQPEPTFWRIGSQYTYAGFLFSPFTAGGFILSAPHWFLVPLVGTLAVLPWFRWRFSLGALLIAMAVVAMALAAAIWVVN